MSAGPLISRSPGFMLFFWLLRILSTSSIYPLTPLTVSHFHSLTHTSYWLTLLPASLTLTSHSLARTYYCLTVSLSYTSHCLTLPLPYPHLLLSHCLTISHFHSLTRTSYCLTVSLSYTSHSLARTSYCLTVLPSHTPTPLTVSLSHCLTLLPIFTP